MVNNVMIKQAVMAMNESMKDLGRELNVEEISSIVENHAVTTALSAAAAGAIPGAGGTIAIGIAVASTVTMYGRLAKAMGVRLNNGLIKALASAVIADLAATVVTQVVLTAAVSFIPAVGNMASSVLTGISNFALVYLAGLIFIKLITALGVTKVERMNEEELKTAAKNVQKTMDIKAALKEAKKVYRSRKNG